MGFPPHTGWEAEGESREKDEVTRGETKSEKPGDAGGHDASSESESQLEGGDTGRWNRR